MLTFILFYALMFCVSDRVIAGDGGERVGCPVLDECKIAAGLTDEEMILGLAHKLFHEKDFLRAAEEYMRFYRLFPDNPLSDHALFRAGLSYMKASLWQEAADRLEKFEKTKQESSLAPKAMYLRGQCLKNMGRFDDARAIWSRAFDRYPESLWGQRAGIEKALSKGEEGDYSETLGDLMDIGPRSRFHDSARLMAKDLAYMDQIPQKNATTAGILSAVLPGSGQFYLGRYRHGSVALLLNGLTIWGAVEAFENADDGIAAALLVVEAIWYSASIVGALSAAHKMNRQAQRDYFLNLEQRYFYHRYDEPRGQGAGLELRLSF